MAHLSPLLSIVFGILILAGLLGFGVIR